jgi:hypothetical protein
VHGAEGRFGVRRANDVTALELHRERQRVDGGEQQSEERPLDSGRLDGPLDVAVVLGDHVGLPLGGWDDRPRGEEHQPPYPGLARGRQ